MAQNLRLALSATEAEQYIDVDNSTLIFAPAMEDGTIQEIQEENKKNDEDVMKKRTLSHSGIMTIH